MSDKAENTIVETGEPQEWKKYSTYVVKVNPDQDDRATEIKLLSFARPHMRAFHCTWWSFFMAFFIWFAISPLLSEIRTTLKLTKGQVWTSSVVGVAGTILIRFILGPMCDKFGPRVPFVLVLCGAAIPTACTGLVNSSSGLSILRLFIGLAGGSFVMCQAWMSRMFAKEIVGTANAMTAGWGNLGGGVTQLVMGSMLFPLFKSLMDDSAERAWRTVCIVPAVVTFLTGIALFFVADDSPKGNYTELKKYGNMPEISATASFRSGAVNFNSWLLFFQYAGCFGVELTMNNAAALYFKDEFGQSTESAAAIASLFGWMNLFARGTGGYLSDKFNAKMGMRGRLWVQALLLLGEGIMVLVFSEIKTLAGAIVVMVIFSLFVQAAEGSTFGIVPYVDPPSTGSISGIVGAGGNVGAVCLGLCFRQLEYKPAFLIMGGVIVASGISTILIHIKGHAQLLWGKDAPLAMKTRTLAIPELAPEPEEDVSNNVKTGEVSHGVETGKIANKDVKVQEEPNQNVTIGGEVLHDVEIPTGEVAAERDA